MHVIGIDTTTRAFCMALIRNTEILDRILVEDGGYHAEDFVAYLKDMLERQALKKQDIDGYAISIGPGSLTGVRVGLSFLKGIGLPTGTPVVGIKTLFAIAHQVKDTAACVCPMLLTRREQLFWSVYQFLPEEKALIGASCTSIDALLQQIPQMEILFTGSGVERFRNVIQEQLGAHARFDESGMRHPDPATIAILGLERIRDGKIPHLAELEPIYL